MKSSLGPKGLDKILISPDGELTITNDGATILKEIHVEHQIGKLLVDLSQSQDNEIGDGTTGVVVLAGALLEESEKLLLKGIHPSKIALGFEKACQFVSQHLSNISERLEFSADNPKTLLKVAKTSLGSKIVSKCHDLFADIAVKSVFSVADFERNDVDFELIKIQSKIGGDLSDSFLVNGVLIEKEFSHPQMSKEISNAKISILTCPFEPPRPKTKHKLDITNVEEYDNLRKYEKRAFDEMILKIKLSGANTVICQWGFDDEANHLLLKNGINAIRWVGGSDIELIALSTNSRIVPRFKDLTESKLGSAGIIREMPFGTAKERLISIEECPNSRICTVLIRGSSEIIIEEAKRSLHDAMCAVRNLIRDNSIVYGGGAAEISCSNALRKHADVINNIDQYIFNSFADALDSIPLALALNSGLNAIETLSSVRKMHFDLDTACFGIDCNLVGTNGNIYV